MVSVADLVRELRIEGLLHEPTCRRPRVTRRGDEAALLLDGLEGRADLEVWKLVVDDDFTTEPHRVVFRYLCDAAERGDTVPDVDAMIDALADRAGTAPAVVRRELADILERPSAWHTTPAEKASALHDVGKLRRVFDACARLDAEARTAAAEDERFNAGAVWSRFRVDVPAAWKANT